MRVSWIVIPPMLLAAGAAGFYILNKNTQGPAAEDVRLVHPEQREIRTTVNATGPVRLRVGSEVRVGSQLSGIVRKLYVTVGSHVTRGELIAEIDDRPLQARLADARAQAELGRASMERTRVDYERARRLASEGLIPKQQEEDLRLALAEAQARHEKSLRDCELVKVDLEYVRIRAPISGIVASVSTQEGETVAASFTAPTFVTIIGDHALELVAMVDETDIANVKPGNPVTFNVDAYPAHDFPGVVTRIAPKATIVSGVVNYEVGVDIRRDTQLLKPDMTANVSIQTARHVALVLPSGAVQREGSETFVHVPGKSGLERRDVIVGSSDAGMVEIRRGVAASDSVMFRSANGGRRPS